MDEMLEVMRGLWAGGMFEYHGEFFDFPRITLSPTPRFELPIYFGGSAPVALRRTAREGDGWIGAGNPPAEVPGLMRELERLRAEQERAHLPFETLVGIYAKPDLELFKSMEGTGMTAGLNMPFPYAFGGPSSMDQKRRMMEAFAESVIRHFP
jgi:alkanesulfonate monooxygenase SsuD/methylene tetrahydromethanopterin reductase-like flavin-dependent oxidoreductase (luciferase family)